MGSQVLKARSDSTAWHLTMAWRSIEALESRHQTQYHIPEEMNSLIMLQQL
jgi:hypothetical protein